MSVIWACTLSLDEVVLPSGSGLYQIKLLPTV